MIFGLVFAAAQISLTIIYSYFLEWFFHIILHNRKFFKSGFKHHFGVHHNLSRKNKMYDKNYVNPLNIESWFEPLGLSILAIVHLPLLFLFSTPIVYLTLLASMTSYYYHHRKSHIDVEWGKNNMPWHYEHHMGKDQHKNWGVRTNFFDKIFNTASEKYESIK